MTHIKYLPCEITITYECCSLVTWYSLQDTSRVQFCKVKNHTSFHIQFTTGGASYIAFGRFCTRHKHYQRQSLQTCFPSLFYSHCHAHWGSCKNDGERGAGEATWMGAKDNLGEPIATSASRPCSRISNSKEIIKAEMRVMSNQLLVAVGSAVMTYVKILYESRIVEAICFFNCPLKADFNFLSITACNHFSGCCRGIPMTFGYCWKRAKHLKMPSNCVSQSNV